MAKKYDLAVKTGSYTDRDGNTKNRYENIGVILDGQDGPYMMLKKTFNPAGIASKEGSDSIIVSLFKPRDEAGSNTGQQQHSQAKSNGYQSQPIDDEIPF